MERILISGAGGFIGSQLLSHFEALGYQVSRLSRTDLSASPEVLSKKLSDADVLIHLAGAPIMKRWTKAWKEELIQSRVASTEKVVKAMEMASLPPRLFISASAVGIYKNKGCYTESDFDYGDGFLSQLCMNWESEAHKASSVTRTAIFRFGVVLDKRGGALKKMLFPFKLGLGGRIGSGKQWMPWIHLEDVIRAFDFVMANKELDGVFNITAPEAVNNKIFTSILAKAIKRPALFIIPSFVLNAIYGKASVVLTQGQCAVPDKLLKAGFSFKFPQLESAFEDIFLNQ